VTIVAAAVIPGAPVLVPGLDGALQSAAEPRAGCLRALRRVAEAGPDEILIVAEGDREQVFGQDTSHGLHRLGGLAYAVTRTGRECLPVPLAVGAALLREAGWEGPVVHRTLASDAPTSNAIDLGQRLRDAPERRGLVLMASGSARMTDKAPGAFHPGAKDFAAAYLRVLRSGTHEDFLATEALPFAEQLSDARLPLQVLAGALPGTPIDTVIDFAQEFHGVFYACASFIPEGAGAG